MKIRDYTPTDHEACLAVFDTNVGKYFVETEREEFSEFLNALPGPYLVIETDSGEVVGCGGYAPRAGVEGADLCWGMVARLSHRKGLGRLLTEERVRRIRNEGVGRSVLLGTSQHTVGFYESLGFIIESHIPDGYAPGIDRYDMRLLLDRRPLLSGDDHEA